MISTANFFMKNRFLFILLILSACNKEKVIPEKKKIECSLVLECSKVNDHLVWIAKVKTSEEVVLHYINWYGGQYLLEVVKDSVELMFVENETALVGDWLLVSKDGDKEDALASVVFREYVVR